jgi:methylmalonyl-CoA decarboxylase
MNGTIETTLEDGVCTLTLRNEGKRNAISYPMLNEAINEIRALESKDGDYVLVFTGAGDKAFSAGFDLSQERDYDKEQWWKELNDIVESYEYPTVAMVNGDTYGGAIEIISACDMRIGVRDARFGITPAKIGLVYSPEAITRVVRLVGQAKAKELLFTGNAIDGEHANEIGLLNYAVDESELEARTYDLAETMTNNAPLSLKNMKKIIAALNATKSLSEAERKWGREMRSASFESHDYEEGVQAFRENRQPEFEGR